MIDISVFCVKREKRAEINWMGDQFTEPKTNSTIFRHGGIPFPELGMGDEEILLDGSTRVAGYDGVPSIAIGGLSGLHWACG